MKSVARLKLQYFGHVVSGSAGELSLTILRSSKWNKTPRSTYRMSWIHNVLKWSGKTYGELNCVLLLVIFQPIFCAHSQM